MMMIMMMMMIVVGKGVCGKREKERGRNKKARERGIYPWDVYWDFRKDHDDWLW